MKKEYIQKALRQTETCLITFNQGKADYLIDCLHENCMWIGARDEEFYFGKAEITGVLRQLEADMPVIGLSRQTSFCVSQDQHSCTVAGRYMGTVVQKDDALLQEMQRYTFIWKLTEDKSLSIVHIHVSNPLANLAVSEQGEELFPHRFSQQMYQYLKQQVQEKSHTGCRIMLTDIEGINWYIGVSEIIALEAVNLNTIIRLPERSLEIRMLMGELLERLDIRLPKTFVRIHKSYVVNKTYVLRNDGLTLQAESYCYPISRRRRKAILQMLE